MTSKSKAIVGTIAAAIVAGSIVTLKQPTEPLPPLPPGWTPSTTAQRTVVDGPLTTNLFQCEIPFGSSLELSYTPYGPWRYVTNVTKPLIQFVPVQFTTTNLDFFLRTYYGQP